MRIVILFLKTSTGPNVLMFHDPHSQGIIPCDISKQLFILQIIHILSLFNINYECKSDRPIAQSSGGLGDKVHRQCQLGGAGWQSKKSQCSHTGLVLGSNQPIVWATGTQMDRLSQLNRASQTVQIALGEHIWPNQGKPKGLAITVVRKDKPNKSNGRMGHVGSVPALGQGDGTLTALNQTSHSFYRCEAISYLFLNNISVLQT